MLSRQFWISFKYENTGEAMRIIQNDEIKLVDQKHEELHKCLLEVPKSTFEKYTQLFEQNHLINLIVK